MTFTLPSIPLPRRSVFADLLVLFGLAAIIFGVMEVAAEWQQPYREAVKIDLSPSALPFYTLLSLSRGVIAYLFSLLFTIGYGYWAFHDKAAGKVLLPLLDILQSIPVLGFLPEFVLTLIHLFPWSNIGLELACVLMIFTAQVWNMTFSFYDSLRAIPEDYWAISRLYGFTRWQRLFKLELPFAARGLVYNSMLSMAGGWFFLTINESFQLPSHDFRLPGIGSYMSTAIHENNVPAQIYAVIAMTIMIVAVDQIIWRPLVVWSQKFKLEDIESAAPETSWLLKWLSQARFCREGFEQILEVPRRRLIAKKPEAEAKNGSEWMRAVYLFFLVLSVVLALWGLTHLIRLLAGISFREWRLIGGDLAITMARVMASVLIGCIWTIPAGVWIGLNPKWSRWLQPFIQVAASFPAPMIFPIVVFTLFHLGITMGWASIALLVIGTQWYILFNVVSGASAIPQDLLACTSLMRLSTWTRWRRFLLPAIFPSLITGLLTATGGAWNATIVAEYLKIGDNTYSTRGLGSLISQATDQGQFSLLAGAVLVMACVVVMLNRSLWKPLQALADARFRITN